MTNFMKGDLAGHETIPGGQPSIEPASPALLGLVVTEMPHGNMSDPGGDVVRNMPGELSTPVHIATGFGLEVTSMPAGSMTAMGDMDIGEIPGAQMGSAHQATMAGMTVTQMPTGEMVGQDASSGEMPVGQMMASPIAALATMAGLAETTMPLGSMTGEVSGAALTGELPIIELQGEWRLFIKPTSLNLSK